MGLARARTQGRTQHCQLGGLSQPRRRARPRSVRPGSPSLVGRAPRRRARNLTSAQTLRRTIHPGATETGEPSGHKSRAVGTKRPRELSVFLGFIFWTTTEACFCRKPATALRISAAAAEDV